MTRFEYYIRRIQTASFGDPRYSSKFIKNSIKEMLATGTILERDHSPEVINPLSTSIDSSGKKRLILDLGYVNMHLYEDKIKLDDWKCFENYLLVNKGYLFKFDLKMVIMILTFSGFLGISMVLQNISYLMFYPLPCHLHHSFLRKWYVL